MQWKKIFQMDEVTAIKQFLESHKVHISSEWLQDCITWCKEEALPHNYSLKDLKEKVFEQWLLLDLRDIEVACLPPNLSSKQKFSLSGTYFLQIMEIVDISKPKYWQIQRIRNETPKNLENETMNSKRMLMMTLTDGVQEVKAMEMKPIPTINLNLNPGTKVKFIGPIMIRRGTFMLEEHNIKIIGGEVDTLLITNAAENILARDLKLQLNPNPLRVQESLIATTDNLNNSDSLQNNSERQFPENMDNNRSIPNNQNPRNSNSIVNNTNFQNPVKNVQYPYTDQFDTMYNFFEDEDKINEEIEMMMEIEREMENSKNKSTKNIPQKSPDIFDNTEIDDFSFELIEIPKTVPKSNIANQKLSHKNNINDANLSKSLEEGNEVFENLDLNIDIGIKNDFNSIQKSSLLKDISEDTAIKSDCKISEAPINKPKITLWTIEKLNKNISSINNGKFKIKAKFKNIIEKLSVADNKFQLVVEVEDDTGSITLKFDDEIVGSLAGCTSSSLMRLKSQVEENIVEAQTKVLSVLKTLKDNLIKFESIVEVIVNSKYKYPLLNKIL